MKMLVLIPANAHAPTPHSKKFSEPIPPGIERMVALSCSCAVNNRKRDSDFSGKDLRYIRSTCFSPAAYKGGYKRPMSSRLSLSPPSLKVYP